MGKYVAYEDYAGLKAELDKYRKDVTNSVDDLLDERKRLKADNDCLKEAISDSYKAVDEMEKKFKELEAEFEMHPMAAENALLMAEVDRLMALVESNLNKSKVAMAKSDASIRTLEEQVERLTKAGDAMAMTVYDMVNRKKPTYGSDLLDLAMEWKAAAKEGKPNA